MLSWVQRLPRYGGIEPTAAEFPAPPGENPIRSLLTEAAIPWLWSRAAVIRRYGVRPHRAYGWNVIEIAGSQSLLDGLLWPLSEQALPQFSPRVPIIEFSSAASIGNDARTNLQHLVEQLEPRLGSPAVADASNTVARHWRYGAASLRLTVWPADLERFVVPNLFHDRNPRLKTVCHVQIETGFRLAASLAEIAQLASFVPIGDLPGSARRSDDPSPLNLPPDRYVLEFVREPPGDMSPLLGRVGCSSDRQMLIFCADQLYLVPMSAVMGFEVERMSPARGSGKARLYAWCCTDLPDVATKRLAIVSSPGPDDLNSFTEILATATGKPFKLDDYVPDE